jgi:hypothetical protein
LYIGNGWLSIADYRVGGQGLMGKESVPAGIPAKSKKHTKQKIPLILLKTCQFTFHNA